jgi:hypothetical protein
MFIKCHGIDQTDVDETHRARNKYGDEETRSQASFGKPEGKRPLQRYKRRWKDNIKTDSKETE